eukprot:865134-Ditylum_brightwellii.AAC.1
MLQHLAPKQHFHHIKPTFQQLVWLVPDDMVQLDSPIDQLLLNCWLLIYLAPLRILKLEVATKHKKTHDI